MIRYYFAYGSCMDLGGRITRDGYSQDFKYVGIGELSNYRFRMNKIAGSGNAVYANIVPTPGGKVLGKLYEITERVEKDYLDEREGYPTHYTKAHVSIRVGEDLYEDVLVYVATPAFTTDKTYPTSLSYELELRNSGRDLPASYLIDFYGEIDQCVKARKPKNIN